jgi:hypothetical protein
MPIKNPLLHRYWLEFDRAGGTEPLARRGLLLGCGVTAFTADDATQLVREFIFENEPIPPVARIIEDVDITTLDAGHVRPNMNEPVSRGIWYPIGYWPSGGTP